jgi:hypothetical protein
MGDVVPLADEIMGSAFLELTKSNGLDRLNIPFHCFC